MAKIITGQSFNAGDQITSTKLNNIIGDAKLDSDSVTGTTLNLTNGQLKVATDGISSNEIANNAVGTNQIADGAVGTDQISNDAVTLAKIQDISTSKVIGRTTAGSGNAEEVSILNETDMSSNSSTALATQASIKAYVAQQVVLSDKIIASANISTASGNLSISKSHGLATSSGVVRNAAGNYTFTFSSTQDDANYIVVATRTDPSPREGDCVVTNKTTTSFDILSNLDDNGLDDPVGLNVIVLNY